MVSEIPDEPGPALLGKKPVLGTLRRSLGIPVLRDQFISSSPLEDGNSDGGDSSDDSEGEPEADSVGRRVPTIDF